MSFDAVLEGREAESALPPASRMLSVPSNLIAQIRELHRKRDGEMRLHGSIVRDIKSQCRRVVGFSTLDETTTRAASMKLAAAVHKAVMAGEPDTEQALAVTLICDTQLQMLKFVEDKRKTTEKQLSALAKQLHVAAFVEGTPGFGYLGLAQIVGEAGDLSLYANPAKVWKRFGLAPHNGKAPSEWRKKGGLSADEWKAVGYSPVRRSSMFVLGDALVKCQGPYRELYLTRKAYEEAKAPTLTKMAWHRRAQRYMEKRLLRDLWRAWRGQVGEPQA